MRVYRITTKSDYYDEVEAWFDTHPEFFKVLKTATDEEIKDHIVNSFFYGDYDSEKIDVQIHPSCISESRKSFIKNSSSDVTLYYYDTPEVHRRVFNCLISEYYSKYGHIGEIIMQSDDAQIYAPDVLAHIADEIIKFEDSYDED